MSYEEMETRLMRRYSGVCVLFLILVLVGVISDWFPGVEAEGLVATKASGRVTIHGLGLSDDAEAIHEVVKNYQQKSTEFMHYENGLFAYGLDENGLLFGADGVQMEYNQVKIAERLTPRENVIEKLGAPTQTAHIAGEVKDYYREHKLAVFYDEDWKFKSVSIGPQAVRGFRAGLH